MRPTPKTRLILLKGQPIRGPKAPRLYQSLSTLTVDRLHIPFISIFRTPLISTAMDLPRNTQTLPVVAPIPTKADPCATSISRPVPSSPSKQSKENIFKVDEGLNHMLDKLERIKTYKRFQGWKKSFLNRLESFFLRRGIQPAQNSADAFKKTMEDMKKHVDKCNHMIEKGDLTNEKVTVKGRNSLNELVKHLTLAIDELVAFIPGTKADERQCGYSKFDLGAVLVRDGFTCFDNMKHLHESVLFMKESKLNQVADRQQLDAFEYYSKKFQNFCDIMADLGLYELMLASRKFAEAPEFDEPDMIEITIMCSNGKNISLEIDSSETIGEVKETIADECGIEPSRQILKFKGNKLDQNEASLDDSGIEDESILTVEPPIIQITVNCMDGRRMKLDVDPADPIEEIKKKLEQKTGMPIDNQRLFQDGKELLDNAKPAEEYGIQAGSELNLEPDTINISVETPEGTQLKLPVKLSNTVGEIKEHVAAKTGIPVHKQVVEYMGKNLTTDANPTTVKELGVQDGDLLKAKIAKIPIEVRTPDGRSIDMMIDPDESLKVIKKEMEGEIDVPSQKINLFLDDKELVDDEKTPTEYGVKSGSILHILRVIYFVDEDTGAVGRLPINKVMGGWSTVQESSYSKGSEKNEITKRIHEILG